MIDGLEKLKSMNVLTTINKSVFLFFFFFCFSMLYGQTGTIRGFVYEKETGEPVMFTNVVLKGTSFGAATDVNGYYAISKVTPGDYVLYVSSLGFETVSINVSVKSNEIINKKIILSAAAVNLDAVDISGEKQEYKIEVRTSVIKATPKEIKQVPTVGGEADIAQYLQVLPGVVFTGSQGGQLYIRGGSPIQNKVLLDGMVVYNPFHSIGLFSVFDTDIIKNADIYTGGFGAEYGGRISSIMDIKTKDGNKKRITGRVATNTFGSKAIIEGPIGKSSEDGSGTSFVFTAKNSYLEQSSKLFYNYIDTAGLPYNFADFYGKTSFNSNNGSKLNVFGFNFNDKVSYKSVSDLNWKSYGGGSNFVVIPGSSPVLIEGNFAYSKYDIQMTEKVGQTRNSAINGFNMGFNFTYFLGDNELKYGIETEGFMTDFYFRNAVNQLIQQKQNTTQLGAYMKYKYVKGKLIIEPSFRAQYYASLPEFSPEPRLAAKLNLSDRVRLKLSGGLYSQNFLSANSDRDVVSLFSGFLSGPDDLQRKFTDQQGNVYEVSSRLQKANHAIAGVEWDITKNLNLNVEVYNKNFTQLANLNRNKLYEDNADNSDKPDLIKKDFIIESGQAYGIDFALKYEYKKFYFWGTYSLAKVDRWDGTISYYPIFDRRHNANLMTSYVFGKGLDWEFNARWNYGSGFPFTPNQGFFQPVDFSSTGVNTNYATSNVPVTGSPGLQFGNYNSSRLSSFHRLDITLKRRFELSSHSTLETVLSITNAYDRQNIFYINRYTNQRVNQLPFMPSAGMSLTF